jgi:hypothetical protein
MSRRKEALPEPLSSAARELTEWRATRFTKQQRIPEKLWARAAKLALKFGVSRTAHALRLRYYGLKSRMESAARREGAGPAFVEIIPAAARPEYVVEFEDRAGRKMRIRLATGMADVEALFRLFLQGRA